MQLPVLPLLSGYHPISGLECIMWKTHQWFNIQTHYWNLYRFVYDAAERIQGDHWSSGAWAHWTNFI